jgi:hypothetical protein
VNVVTFLTRVLQQRRSSLRHGRRLAIRIGGRWPDGGLKRWVVGRSGLESCQGEPAAEHAGRLMFLNVEPRFDSVRSERGYAELVRLLGFRS